MEAVGSCLTDLISTHVRLSYNVFVLAGGMTLLWRAMWGLMDLNVYGDWYAYDDFQCSVSNDFGRSIVHSCWTTILMGHLGASVLAMLASVACTPQSATAKDEGGAALWTGSVPLRHRCASFLLIYAGIWCTVAAWRGWWLLADVALLCDDDIHIGGAVSFLIGTLMLALTGSFFTTNTGPIVCPGDDYAATPGFGFVPTARANMSKRIVSLLTGNGWGLFENAQSVLLEEEEAAPRAGAGDVEMRPAAGTTGATVPAAGGGEQPRHDPRRRASSTLAYLDKPHAGTRRNSARHAHLEDNFVKEVSQEPEHAAAAMAQGAGFCTKVFLPYTTAARLALDAASAVMGDKDGRQGCSPSSTTVMVLTWLCELALITWSTLGAVLVWRPIWYLGLLYFDWYGSIAFGYGALWLHVFVWGRAAEGASEAASTRRASLSEGGPSEAARSAGAPCWWLQILTVDGLNLFVGVLATVPTWAGIWVGCDVLIFPDHLRLSFITTHFIGLALLVGANSMVAGLGGPAIGAAEFICPSTLRPLFDELRTEYEKAGYNPRSINCLTESSVAKPPCHS